MIEQRGWLAGATVLDLFAGSGALGIEALSRGAEAAIFVEAEPAAVRTLRGNLAASGLADRGEVLPMPVPRALRALARRRTVVDGVLADPPYGAGWAPRALAAVEQAGVLAPGGWIALEHRDDEPPSPPPGLDVVQTRRHGRTVLTLLAHHGETT